MKPRPLFVATPLVVALVAALLLAAPQRVWATSPEAAAGLIQTLGARALDTLQKSGQSLSEREAAFGAILREGFDLNFIGRFVLGKYWRQASADQRSDYLKAFSDYVILTYARRLGGFKGQSFAIVDTRVSGEKKDVLVATRIERPRAEPIVAAWRVREFDGAPRIIDVVVEGVSMGVTQRQEFASIARRSGIDGLVQILRAQTQKLSAASG